MQRKANRIKVLHSTDAHSVLFLARHGEGWHNVAEAFYGTPAWDCYWAEENGNGTISWVTALCSLSQGPDALLTPRGIGQALQVNEAWKAQIKALIPIPQRFYSSPLSRAASTLNLTWSDIIIDVPRYVHPIFLEDLRESIGLHTCDKRRSKDYLRKQYPKFIFRRHFSRADDLWTPKYQETSEQQTLRLQRVLDWIWRHDDNTYISVTAHSGTIAAILRNIGHREFKVQTGGMIPVVVKAFEKVS
jgi:broad specificity phosphatase PhoE